MTKEERDADRRAVTRIEKQVVEKAKQFARRTAAILNGTARVGDYLEIDGKLQLVPTYVYEEEACRSWLAEFLKSWQQAGYRWSRWPHREKIQAHYLIAVTDDRWPKLTIQRKPPEPIPPELDRPIPMHEAVSPRYEAGEHHHNVFEFDEEEREEDLAKADEEGWHRAVEIFVRYMVSPAFNTIRRCDRPACGRYFVYGRPNKNFCSTGCTKKETRRKSTRRTRATGRQRTLTIVQNEIDRFTRKGFAAQSAFMAHWKRWEIGIAEGANTALVDAGLEYIQSNWITRAIHANELKPPRLKPPVDE